MKNSLYRTCCTDFGLYLSVFGEVAERARIEPAVSSVSLTCPSNERFMLAMNIQKKVKNLETNQKVAEYSI